MGKSVHILVYLLFYMILWEQLSAQQYRFRTYSLEEGLPQSEVTDLLEDSRGILWIATNGGGVARFNGQVFKVLNQEDGLVYNRVKRLYEDSKKNLWFITERGASRYDGRRFYNYTEKDLFSNGTYFEVSEDSKGNLWFLSKKDKGTVRLFYWNQNNFIDFSLQYLTLLQNNSIISIGINAQDDLIIQTEKGFFEYKNDKLIESPINTLLPYPLGNIRLYGQTKNKKVRLLVENPSEKQVELYFYQNGKLEKVHDLGNFSIKDLLHLTEDRQSNFWYSVDKRGVYRIDPQANRFNLSVKNGLPTTRIDMILVTKNRNVWLSSYGKGLIQYFGDTFTQFYVEAGLETGLVWAITQDKEGGLWVGETGEQPLCRFDGSRFIRVPVEGNSYLKRISDIAFDQDGTMLVGSSRGVWYYRGGTLRNASQRYNLPEEMQITAIQVTKQGIWFASYQNGLYFYDATSQKTNWLNSKNTNLVSDLVNDIFEDTKGNIWVCTNYGISVYRDGQFTNFSKKEGLPNEYALTASEDKNGCIWIATLGGLLKYTPQTQKFLFLQQENGILSNNIYSVLVDTKNQVWLGTQLGISRLRLDKQSNIISIKNYSKNSGFTGLEANEKAIFEDQQGNIWFGTVRGLIRYEPHKESEEEEKIQLSITDVDLYLQNTDWLDKKLSKFHDGLFEWSFVPRNLRLPYDQNYLSFHFEVSNHNYYDNIRYQWKLDGLETEWSKLSSKTEAVYTNLPPNRYTFKVRAITADGLQSSEIVSYSFRITPAFWQTWWFAFAIFLFIALVIIFFVRQRFLLMEKQKEILQVKIAEASKTLLEQNNALLEQKKEIEKQKIDLQQLNSTKDKFFSILAHDIKGPLNSLTAFLNIMTNHLDEMSQDDIRFMSSNLNKSVKNLYSLLENVLSWSRSQMGVLEYKYEAIDLYEIIEQNVQLLAVSAQNKGIQLTNNAEKGIIAWADKNSIHTVLRNLISNAIKFTSTDGTVDIQTQIINGKEVAVSVIDTGVGMSEEVKKKIFQIDARYTTKGTANEVGTGLGLVLVKEFVEKNNGILQVKSQEGKGSIFTFTLSLYQNENNHNETQKNTTKYTEHNTE